jgi:hypothetical protein
MLDNMVTALRAMFSRDIVKKLNGFFHLHDDFLLLMLETFSGRFILHVWKGSDRIPSDRNLNGPHVFHHIPGNV